MVKLYLFVWITFINPNVIIYNIAARGIDIPNIDWIIQLAAPKDPSFFVHRVGRTARAGRSGQALIFLTEDESAYIELLRGRGVPLSEYNLELPCLSTTETGTGIDIDISIEKATDIAVTADSQLPSESVKVMPAGQLLHMKPNT